MMGKQKKVVLYSSSSCAKCREAKQYFMANGITYAEFDVQKNRRGAKEFARLNGRAVPIILIGGERLNGFNKRDFETLYRD